MRSRVVKKMSPARLSVLVFVVVALVTTVFLMKMGEGLATPGSATDSTKVPHYFGPNPNWALSPLTLPDVAVTVSGDGTGAAATATVGANGAVTGITITDPGSGYTNATVSFTGAGTGATADAVVTASGAVTSIKVDAGGAGYTKPVVAISGGGATTDATATAYGGVDQVVIGQVGGGYTMPTVDFDMPDDPNGVQAKAHAEWDPSTGAITGIIVDDPGSGYMTAPNVVVRDGTLMDPINGGTGATATATLKVQSITVDTFGAGYTSAPSVAINDANGSGTGAAATATTDAGTVSAINLTAGGSGYVSGGGIRKFVDDLPGLCDPAGVAGPVCPQTGKYIPLAVPEQKTYNNITADQFEIALVQYRTQFSSDLPATLVRGYVQVDTGAIPGSQHVPLQNELRDGTKVPVLDGNGQQLYGVTPPQWLGPVIAATKDKPVRIVFRNALPTGKDGDLFLPTDSTMMGSGMGPMQMADPTNDGTVLDQVRSPVCSEYPKDNLACFADNRATLHLHGGITPWISDGTPHQWITPAGENTSWPEGVSVQNVPDMTEGTAANDGVQTFYYTNQQSARLMFYHDHSWGITRLNVYAGEAAGYTITDDTEKALVNSGTIPGAADTLPLIVQDRTFVPSDTQLYDQKDANGNVTSYGQDPTWDQNRWGKYGDLWYHHVYMPAQNPGDPSGMSAYGRWMYGPWFWPPAAATKYGPIDNPYYDPNCKLDDPTTWQYQTDPFCEPKQIPGTPNVSAGMEQFNDTPVVNGVAYPKVTLEPKTYRLRLLNAANDRFFNFQWYVADSTGTEVALKPAELAAAQTDPTVFPTPVDANNNAAGPDWVQIGSEGGFLPAPTVVDGQQPTTWITDPTRFDFGNVDKHSLLLAPAERADVIVDFSKYAGKTLILYNDAPAAFPARVPSYDYYTGGPDLSPVGAPGVLPGYGPNTRTVMQVTIAAGTPAPAFDMTKLRNAFSHKANGTGAFESGQHPIIVGQASYNSAYGTNFASASDCNAPGSTKTNCDGYVRVNDTTTFGFNTLKGQSTKTTMPLQPKAIHDEMNATTFDEYGRMQANLGVEAQPPTPGLQNVTLYPFVNPQTELIDGTNLPKNSVTYDANGNPVSDVKIAPMATDGKDGTQIWRITHNGVDTHPIHFHLYDVQVINRVTWDNIIIPPDPSELGWKDTVRISPLEDTIVALRPIVPQVPFEIPNSVRTLNPMMPKDSTAAGFNNIDPQGNPTAPVANRLVNFGWEYVYHCHILSHEEMDMMRPVSLVLPPNKPDQLQFAVNNGHVEISWQDNSITETAFVVQRTTDGTTWTNAGTVDSPLDQSNTHGARSFTDPAAYDPTTVYQYRVVAQNTVGYGAEFPSMTAQSVSDPVQTGTAPAAPTNLSAALQTAAAPAAPQAKLAAAPSGLQVSLTFTDNATDETGFTVQRSDNGGAWATVATLPSNSATDPTVTGAITYTDTTVQPGTTYDYKVRADKGAAASAWSNTATVLIPAAPAAPSGLTATLQAGPQVALSFTDNATNETGFTLQRADNGGAWTNLTTLPANAGSGAVTFTDTTVTPGNSYDYRVRADNGPLVSSAWSNTATVAIPAVPAAPTSLTATLQAGPKAALSFTDNATNETGFTVQRATNGGAWTDLTTLPASAGTGTVTYTDTTIQPGNSYDYRVRADNGPVISSAWSNTATVVVPVAPAAPTSLSAALQAGPQVALSFTDNATNETGFTVQRAANGGAWADLATLPAHAATGAVSYTDSTVQPGTSYDYRVRADNGPAVSSAWSNTATVLVPAIPAAPSALTSSVLAGPQVTLAWTDNATNETGYTIQRALGNGAFADIVTLGANSTTWVDNGLIYGATYRYQIRAFNLSGASAWAGPVSVDVPTLPAAPTNLARTMTRTTAGPDTVALKWTDNATNETGFTIQRATDSAFTTGLTTFSVGPNVTTYTDSVAHGDTYYYRVLAFNVVGVSAWSNTTTATTVPATPTNFRSTGVTRSSVSLAWNDVSSNENAYRIQRRRVGSTNWSTVTTTRANATSYTDRNVNRGTSYDYRIMGINGVGTSPYSPTIRVTTAR